jgi:hypothetical protein
MKNIQELIEEAKQEPPRTVSRDLLDHVPVSIRPPKEKVQRDGSRRSFSNYHKLLDTFINMDTLMLKTLKETKSC